MARVKVCRLCGRHNEPDELFCADDACGTSLADVSAVDSAEIERKEAERREAEGERSEAERREVEGEAVAGAGAGFGAGGQESGAVESSGVEGRQEDQASGAGGYTMREGRTAQAASCTLVFPWGRVPVAGQLGIGREAGFSTISGQLDAFPTVSRRHAVVGSAQGQWVVRDIGSTNGTYVNGTRLAEGETRPIYNGDQVGFSRGLQVTVEIAAAGGASGTPGN